MTTTDARPPLGPHWPSTCPDCGAPVIKTNHGLITRGPGHLGSYRPDGEYLTIPELLTLLHTTGQPGHGPHSCTNATQPTLFDHQEA